MELLVFNGRNRKGKLGPGKQENIWFGDRKKQPK
jgi:hypothetical protein